MEGIIGKWRVTASDNFDAYLSKLGVSWMLRKIASSDSLKPRAEIKCIDGKWHLDTYSTFKNTHQEVIMGEEFEETTVDGRKVKTTVVIEDGKMISTERGAATTTIVRELVDANTLLVTLTVEGVVATRTYTREDSS